MLQVLLSPQSIAFLTSLTPVGAWIAKESGVLSKSLVVSTITEFIKDFFKNRITEKQLKDIFFQSVQATLDDTTLNLDAITQEDLVTTQHSFKNFSRFVDTYDQLGNLPFRERRETAIQIFRHYIQEHVPSISDAALDTIEEHFSQASFGVIDKCIKKSPELFNKEALASLQRIEKELERNISYDEEINKNLEILKTSALYYQKLAPEIEGIGDYLSKINNKIDEIRKVQEYHTGLLNSHSESLIRLEGGMHSIIKKIETPIGKSLGYIALTNELAELQETYNAISENNVSLRLKFSKKIEDQKKLIQLFEQDVIQLADTFQDIPIDTDRLRQAQIYFNEGNFKRVTDWLNAKDLEIDQQRLLAQKEKNLKKGEEFDKQLRHNATEYLIKAQVTTLDYSNPNRFAEAKNYYILSIRSCAFFSNLYNFALFLQNYCHFDDAELVYFRILKNFKRELSLEDQAGTLNNLAALHSEKNEYETAEREYSEALGIYKDLAAANPAVYHPYVAMVLNNLANLHSEKNEHETAEREYSEALTIRRDLAAANPAVYQPDMAMVLNNLANLHSKKNEYETAEREYSEALGIYKDLAATNPAVYQPDVAMALNNLAALHSEKNEYQTAEREYSEALGIYKDLAAANPAVYQPDVAMTLYNLANLHSKKNEYQTAEREYSEALGIYKYLAATNPAVYQPDVAMVLNNLAALHSEKNEYQTAEREYSEALGIYKYLAATNPAVYQPDVAMVLNNLAELHSEKNEYETADNSLKPS